MNINELVRIFIAGITLGNGPCLFICLPIVLPYISGLPQPRGGNSIRPTVGWLSGLKLTAIFSVCRLVAYSLLGFLAVVFYKFISGLIGSKGIYIKFALGVLIILVGVLYLLGEKFASLNPVCNLLHKKIVGSPGMSNLNMVLFGLLIGFSPCAPLAAILAYIAAMAESSLAGLLAGFSFGLGTFITPLIPLGTLTSVFSNWLKKYSKVFTGLRIVSAAILIYFGLQMILVLL